MNKVLSFKLWIDKMKIDLITNKFIVIYPLFYIILIILVINTPILIDIKYFVHTKTLSVTVFNHSWVEIIMVMHNRGYGDVLTISQDTFKWERHGMAFLFFDKRDVFSFLHKLVAIGYSRKENGILSSIAISSFISSSSVIVPTSSWLF